jgi:hypothetical protein
MAKVIDRGGQVVACPNTAKPEIRGDIACEGQSRKQFVFARMKKQKEYRAKFRVERVGDVAMFGVVPKVAAIFAIASLLSVLPAHAQQAKVLKISHQFPASQATRVISAIASAASSRRKWRSEPTGKSASRFTPAVRW